MIKNTLNDIDTWLKTAGQPRFRSQQLHEAWGTVASWEDFSSWPKDLRNGAAARFPWISLEAVRVLKSRNDETRKALLRLHDGAMIESVCMPNARGKFTICISSQVGCGMKCAFCATGTLGLTRNLTADEIVDQVRFWRFHKDPINISNVVFMGMGEPLANFDAVKHAAWFLISVLGIGSTRITVSTVGISGGLQRILSDDDFPPVRIALSIHAGTDATRIKIVPSHKGTSFSQLAQWAKQYVEKFGNRRHHLTLEYVMLGGINDDIAEARALIKNFSAIRHRLKVNLIPWNPTDAKWHATPREQIQKFQRILMHAGIPATIRKSQGLDIDAACGQLALKASQSNTRARS